MIPDTRRCTRELKPPSYPAAAAGFLRMDANTNLYGPNPAIEAALRDGATADLNHYPSGTSDELRAALARLHEVTPDEVLVGDGSDEVLDTLTKAFIDPDDVVAMPVPTFVMYAFYGRINFARIAEVPLKVGWELNVDALLRADAKITFLASPNNPTGNKFDREDIERLIQRSNGIVVVDEAYADFCGQDFVRRTREFENLVVSRTFSKSYGLAGLRVGYAVAPKAIIERMMVVKTPFTVGSFAERVALAALANPAYVEESRKMVLAERGWLADQLKRLGLRPHSTDANFMLVDTTGPAKPVVQKLRERKILVRDMSDFRGLANSFRMTIGRREHNEQLVAALREIGV